MTPGIFMPGNAENIMKKVIAFGLLLSTTLLAGTLLSASGYAATETESKASLVAEQTATFAIDKMTCKMCHITVRKAMEKVDGVVTASVDYETKTASVLFNPSKTNVKAIAMASTNAGYPAKSL
jgi:periplasmic mercuric ion binding protein